MRKIYFIFAMLFVVAAYGIPVDLIHCDFNRTPIEFDENKLAGNPVKIVRTGDGWLLDFAKSGRTESIPMPHSFWKCARPKSVVLRARTLQGRAFVKLNMVDGNGHWFYPEGKMITPDSDRIEFSIDGMPQGKSFCRIMSIQIDTDVPGTKLLLRRIDRCFERPESEAVQIAVDTGNGMLPIFEESPRFILRNATAGAVKKDVEFSFTGLDGAVYSVKKNVDLPPYGEIRFTPENKPPHSGVWYGKPEKDGQRVMFACVPENGLTDPANPEFEFAMDNHWINPAVVEALRYLGIRAIRTIVGWEQIQPESGNDWNFPVFDARLEALEKEGIKMRETLVFTPKWAAESNPKKLRYPRNCKPRMEAWKNYVRAMIKRYGDRVEYFEIWNEPDLTGFVDFPVEDYIELCREARKIAREVNPRLKIASGGFATLNPSLWGGTPGKFHETVLREAADTFDIHSYHEHGYFPHYQKMLDTQFLPLRHRLGITQPWLASETAVHSAKGNDVEQADCLFKKLLFTWARGGFSYTWYGLRNNGYDLNYSEDNFGVFDRFMNPKYIFGVYAAIIRDYREASFVRQLKTSNMPWMFEFKRHDSVLVPNWAADPFGGTVVFYACSDKGNAARYLDLEGNASALPFKNSVAIFPVSPKGSTLQIDGATGIRKVDIAAKLNLPDAVIIDKEAKGNLFIANPWPHKTVCTLEVVQVSGNRIKGLPASIKLAPNQKVTIPFTLLCKTSTDGLKINVKFDNGTPVAVSAPLRLAHFSPDTRFARRRPDFRLRNYAQMECTFEFDPAIANTLWSGPEDLSAEIWLGRNKDRFELLAKVRDDHHCASVDPPHLWQGDSIQFALDFAGQNGHFELGGGLDKQGVSTPDCWIVPQGFNMGVIRKALDVKIKREGNLITYHFSIPLSALGVTPEKLANGFRFNLLVNDNDDGKARKCFLRIAQGIGSMQTMKYSPMVICR